MQFCVSEQNEPVTQNINFNWTKKFNEVKFITINRLIDGYKLQPMDNLHVDVIPLHW